LGARIICVPASGDDFTAVIIVYGVRQDAVDSAGVALKKAMLDMTPVRRQ
jgi:hypothetical protein